MQRIKSLYRIVNRKVFLLLSHSLLTRLLFELVSLRWLREINSIANGKRNYLMSQNNRSELVRNIHRIEKGLVMPNRRQVFAKDYIERTVGLYNAFAQYNSGHRQIRWAHDVLQEYFEVIDSSQLKVSSADIIKLNTTDNRVPPRTDLRTSSAVRSQDLNSLMKRRRSIRFFEQREVSLDIIEKCVEDSSLSPSACNRQPYSYFIIQDVELRNKVASLPMGAGNWAKKAPVFMVVVGEFNHYFDVRDRHVPYIDSSLAVMSFILSLETYGLSSCIINWPDIPKLERKMEKYLDLEPYQRPIMCLAIGYPKLDSRYPFSEKKTAKELIKLI